MDNFQHIISQSNADGLGVMTAPFPVFMNAAGSLCRAKCDAIHGDVAKAKCLTMYLKVPCAWNCSKHPNKPCCKHNKQTEINIANCKKNVDAKRASCKAACVSNAVSDSGVVNDSTNYDETVNDTQSDNLSPKDGAESSKTIDSRKILTYSLIAIASVAGVAFIGWAVGSSLRKN